MTDPSAPETATSPPTPATPGTPLAAASTASPIEHRVVSPDSISAPAANYAHARLTTGATRWLHTSGVVPIAADGAVPTDLVDQACVIWSNIAAMLDAAAMGAEHIVSVTTYVTPGQDLGPVMAIRDRALDGHLAASTLVIVAELARPEWLIEVAIVAAS